MVVIETNVYAWVCGIKFALFFVRGMFASDRKKDAWISQRTWKWLRNTKNCGVIKLTLLQSWQLGVRGIEMKAKNVLPFGQHSDKRTQIRYFYLQNIAKNFIHQMCSAAKYHGK